MSDKFVPVTLDRLAAWIFGDLEARGEVFGVPRELFWTPRSAPFALTRYGVRLETPLGVAAGPHTQLAQNLVLAYLTGSRFLELKTVQTLDELEVAKPCIDAEDATFNCEWSQELRLEESFAEYLHGFVLIHALRHWLGWGDDPGRPGFLFNMSLGYNLEGILRPNMQRFLDRMADAGEALGAAVEAVARFCPGVRALSVPARLSDSVTLSTMHGCPPDEIERIARYLIEERGLHTTVKLNPTLLGPAVLRKLLNERLGFCEIQVPDEAFGHDLKWDDALGMIHGLREVAVRRGVFFGLKLTNTLEVVNHRGVFRADQATMYMSGRALHPITMALAARLLEVLGGQVPISISGGVDAFNLGDVLASGLAPVTVCTDLLKPGGYTRMPQYLELLGEAMEARGCNDLDAWVLSRAAEGSRAAGAAAADLQAAWVSNAAAYARRAAESERHRTRRHPVLTKGERPLGWLDCIEAPCRAGCPAGQDIPAYLHAVATGEPGLALRVIRETNPLPRITGAVCDHPCVVRCVRNHYDDPLAIRQVKRFAAIHGAAAEPQPAAGPSHGGKVAVVGAGPAGLTVAYDLARSGYAVTVFESREGPGGMVSWAIPAFRLTEEDIQADLARVAATGVSFRYGCHLGRDVTLEGLRTEGFGTVVAAMGAQEGLLMGVEGERQKGVMDGLSFLMGARAGHPVTLGQEVCIVGGGNAAMDAARTAWRLVGPQGRVTLLYRRTRAQMPADPDEISALEEEGVGIMELVMPVRVVERSGRVGALECVRMTLSAPDGSGRPRPVPLEGSRFELPCTALVVCVSQRARLEALEQAGAKVTRWGTLEVDPRTGETAAPGVFGAGDAVRGPATVIQAVADGHRVAEAILRRDGRWDGGPGPRPRSGVGARELLGRRARRQARMALPERPVAERRDFAEVTPPLDEVAARVEAGRCLLCSELCSLCVTVCPNRANQAVTVTPRRVELPVLRLVGREVIESGRRIASVSQAIQIVNVTNFCNECGNCATFCPTSGAPYRDKPRLHLDEQSFTRETDRALRLTREGGALLLRAKIDGVEHRLLRTDTELVYGTPQVTLRIRLSDGSLLDAEVGPEAVADGPGVEIDTGRIFELDVLCEGLSTSLEALILPE